MTENTALPAAAPRQEDVEYAARALAREIETLRAQLTAHQQALTALVEEWRTKADEIDDGCVVTACAIAAADLREHADQLDALLTKEGTDG